MAKNDSIKILETKIEILKKARIAIKSGNTMFICIAIDDVKRASGHMHWSELSYIKESVDQLRLYISNALERTSSYGTWLEVKLGRETTTTEDREGRVQWIDWMIRCLEEDLSLREYNVKRGFDLCF